MTDQRLKAYFHYRRALRCVARDIETPIVFYFSRHAMPRNATRSRMEIRR